MSRIWKSCLIIPRWICTVWKVLVSLMAVWRWVPSFGITISLFQLLLFLCVDSRCRNCSPCRSIRKPWADYECAYTRARWEFTAGSHCLPHSSESSWSAESFKTSWSSRSAEYLFTSRVKISGRLGFCEWLICIRKLVGFRFDVRACLK